MEKTTFEKLRSGETVVVGTGEAPNPGADQMTTTTTLVGTEFEVDVARGGHQDEDGITTGTRTVRAHGIVEGIVYQGPAGDVYALRIDGRYYSNNPLCPAYPLLRSSLAVDGSKRI